MSGGSKGTIAVFPVGEKRAHATVDYSRLLGTEIVQDANTFRLVRLDNGSGIAAGAVESRLFDWNAEATYDVDLTGAAVAPCGVTVADQVALDDNDYFWLQVDGQRGTVTDSGSGVTAADYLTPAAAGEAVTDATVAAADHLAQKVFGIAIATAAADEAISFRFLRKLR